MNKIGKKIVISVMVLMSMFFIYKTQAASPDAFIVDVQPSSFDPNSPVDMTIKAIKGDGTVITDYEGDVYIDVVGAIEASEYVVPSEHLYTFLPQDQGVKLFSKGLIIKKAGTYTVQVSDIIDDNIMGEKTIIVGAVSDENLKKITIDSPINSGIERNSVINLLGSANGLPNSPFEVWLNGIPAGGGTTDSAGLINTYISGAVQGMNKLQAKILDISNTVIGQSDIINFDYSPIADGTFNSIQVLPSAKIKQGAKATFIVSTNESVTSVQLNLSDGKSAPMDKESAGTFRKEMTIDTAGNIIASLDLIVAGVKKSYDSVATLIIENATTIGKIRVFGDPVIESKINITRETVGLASEYKIMYGNSQGNLNQAVTALTNEIVIANLSTGQIYYFQIIPLDADGIEAGPASDIVQATVGEADGGANCVVNGIIISDITIGDKHYLTWSGVINVEKYIIYRSDFPTNDINGMQKVAELTGTMFEYPFTKNAKTEKYAYYTVQAICTNGNGVIVDNVKKVVTGPVENILLFIMITLFVYNTYRLYQFSEVEN